MIFILLKVKVKVKDYIEFENSFHNNPKLLNVTFQNRYTTYLFEAPKTTKGHVTKPLMPTMEIISISTPYSLTCPHT